MVFRQILPGDNMLKYLYGAIALTTLVVRALTIYENIQRQRKQAEESKKPEFTLDDFDTPIDEKHIN